MLAANHDVVSPLVQDGVAGFSAHDEVFGRQWIKVNLGSARRAVDREVADIVVDGRAQCAVEQANCRVTIGPCDAVIPVLAQREMEKRRSSLV